MPKYNVWLRRSGTTLTDFTRQGKPTKMRTTESNITTVVIAANKNAAAIKAEDNNPGASVVEVLDDDDLNELILENAWKFYPDLYNRLYLELSEKSIGQPRTKDLIRRIGGNLNQTDRMTLSEGMIPSIAGWYV